MNVPFARATGSAPRPDRPDRPARPRRTRVLAGAAAGALVFVTVPTAGVAQTDGDIELLIDRETLNVRLTPDGEREETRLLSHLTAEGAGQHTIADPAATSSLRSMSGFSTPDSEGDRVLWNVDLDGGPIDVRSMADYEGEVPVEIDVELRLDGELVTAEELEGGSGWLEVTYRLRNVSGEPQEVSYIDADGETVTTEVDVPLPLVGTVQTTLGERFSSIDPDAAIVAGDGEGGTQLQWSVALFEPLGSTDLELTYGARTDDGGVPPVRVSLVPAGGHQSPVDTGLDSYEEITGSLLDIQEGATELDEGALQLADGAAELLDGLRQIAEGTGELAAGLTEANAGAGELVDGIGQARSGGDELMAGAGMLDAGAREASAGSSELRAGTGELSVGAREASMGSRELLAGARLLDDGSAEARDGAVQILDGIEQIQGGLDQLRAPDAFPAAVDGVDQLLAGAEQIDDTLDVLLSGGDIEDPATGEEIFYPGLPFIADGAEELAEGLCEFAESPLLALLPLLGDLLGDLAPDLEIGDIVTQLEEACDGAEQLEEGIRGTEQIVDGIQDGVSGPGDETLLAGLRQLAAGLAEAGDGLGQLADGADELADGQRELIDGLTELDEGTTELRTGAGDLADGLEQIEDGSSELDAGANQLASGLAELATGTGDLREGTVELGDGLRQLDDGGGQLAAGLDEAEAGSQELQEGARDAAEGGEQVAEGSQELRETGTDVLVSEVGEGRAPQALLFAQFLATEERGRTDGMPAGAPDGAEGYAAYVFDLAGTETGSGPGLGAFAAGLLALAIGGLAAAFATTRRS